MWDSKAPLQLLKNMPKKLTMENLEKIQQILDADKYKNSLVSGFDLCGMYAPFCRDCQKTSIYPCALAYIKMLQSQGTDVQIDARPVSSAANKTSAAEEAEKPVAIEKQDKPEPQEAVAEVVSPELHEEFARQAEEEIAVANAVEPEIEEPVLKQPVVRQEKRKIRIAVARKKIF